MLRILFVTSEIHPFIKTGGLADVSGALPKALKKAGVDIRILVPGYRPVLSAMTDKRICATLGASRQWGEVSIVEGKTPDGGIPIYAINYPDYYFRDGSPYQNKEGSDWLDNPARFGLLSKVAALFASESTPLDWMPDILHCNDWQSGLAPAYLHFAQRSRARTVMTIHNIAFQGNFGREWVERLELPSEAFAMHGAEFHGYLSFLKAGLYYADKITTVSPSYAMEIQGAEMGCGMEGLLQVRSADVSGILNGIDTDEWNPACDPHLSTHYDASQLSKKALVKAALQQELGLTPRHDTPLFGIVSRLTYQKGFDLVLECAQGLLHDGAQLAILGSGDHEFENRFRALAQDHPGQVAAIIGFNEALSHRIMAGVDIFLMPSRFEPCGLNQFYGMRYGTPPLVRAIGGLRDSVVDADQENGTGFVFSDPHPGALLHAIHRAMSCFRDQEKFAWIQQNSMARDSGWKISAERYIALYRKLA